MVTNNGFKFVLRYLHGKKGLVFVSLLFMVMLVFSCLVSALNGVSPFILGSPDRIVNNETELRDTINNAPSKTSITIALNNDISLSSTLTIPYNKDITLTSNRSSGFYKLIGVANKAVIVVDGGVLKLDGIIVSGGGDSGICVRDKGVLVMYDGEISDNTSYFYGGFNPWGYAGAGGGVSIDSGVFEMYSGKIFNNQAQSYGGGVYLGLGRAVFKMFGGEISGNTAECGGGVSNGGDFSMFGGTISGNTAEYGGGVYAGGGYANFSWVGGVISGNTATVEGNDVYPDRSGGGSSNGSGSGGGGSSNGNGGSGGSGGGSGSGGGLSNGGFGLRDVLFISVGIIVVMVVVVVVLFLYFRNKIKHVEKTLSNYVSVA
jgi:hypothetical protein